MRATPLLVLMCLAMLLLAGCGDSGLELSPTPIPQLTAILPPAPPPPIDTAPAAAPPAEEPPTDTPEPPAPTLAPSSDWQDFSSETGNFRVSLPGTPKEQSLAVDTPQGKVQMHTFLLAEETVAFVISYADYPAGPSAAALLQTVRDDTLKAGDTQLLGEDKFVWNSYSALALTTQTANAVRRLRAYVVGPRLYTLYGSTATQADRGEDVVRFLDSFALLHPVPSPTPTAPATATPSRKATPTPTTPGRKVTPTRTPGKR